MLKRLAVIVWWCGAVIAALGLGNAALAWSRTLGCEDARGKLARLEDEAAKASARWHEEAKRANPDKNDIELVLQSGAPPEVDGRTAAEQAVKECDRAAREASEGAFLSLAALPFFAIAYVLGGSFFRPPRAGKTEA